jgi:hypothetical protein
MFYTTLSFKKLAIISVLLNLANSASARTLSEAEAACSEQLHSSKCLLSEDEAQLRKQLQKMKCPIPPGTDDTSSLQWAVVKCMGVKTDDGAHAPAEVQCSNWSVHSQCVNWGSYPQRTWKVAPTAQAEPNTYTCNVGTFSWQEQNGRYTLSVDGGKPIPVVAGVPTEVCAHSGMRGMGVLVCFMTQGYADLKLKGQKDRQCQIDIPPQVCDGVLTKDEDDYRLETPDSKDKSSMWCEGALEDNTLQQVLKVCEAGKHCHVEGIVKTGPLHWESITNVKSASEAKEVLRPAQSHAAAAVADAPKTFLATCGRGVQATLTMDEAERTISFAYNGQTDIFRDVTFTEHDISGKSVEIKPFSLFGENAGRARITNEIRIDRYTGQATITATGEIPGPRGGWTPYPLLPNGTNTCNLERSRGRQF